MNQNLRKVLVFRSEYLNVSETFISDHLRTLKRYKAIVGCLREKESLNKPKDVAVYNLQKNFLYQKVYRYLKQLPLLFQLLNREKPDLVHAHFLTDAVEILPVMEKNNIPFVVTAHGYDATTYDEYLTKFTEGKLLLQRKARLIKRVDKILCVSEFIRQELIKRGYPDEKLVVSHLGVDLTKINQREPQANNGTGIVYVGRLVEKKGAQYLLNAYALLPEAIRNIHPLKMIGDGPLNQELKALAEELGIAVNFMGAQPREVVIETITKSRLFVLPSIRAVSGDAEGMPIAIMEALAIGVPLCIFDDQPMTGLIQTYEAGLLAKARDVKDMSEKIASVLVDEQYAALLADHGLHLVKSTFDLQRNVAALEAIYDSVLT